MSLVEKLFGSFSDRELKKVNPITKQVLALEPKYQAMSDADLQAQTAAFKQQLADGKTLDDILPDAFAVCREAAWRVLGMKHFPVQVTGGIALHRGDIAEMQTGEGKTLVATLPAYLNALTGEGVHIVTVNDYLAKRDSEWMGKLYRWLGLTVGLIVQGMDGDARRAAYNADITYGTNNEFGFDYLRDNMVTYKANMVQRGHAYAIVDEVDSILIDEARTPLIISGRGEDSSSLYTQVDRFVRTLRKSGTRKNCVQRSSGNRILSMRWSMPLKPGNLSFIFSQNMNWITAGHRERRRWCAGRRRTVRSFHRGTLSLYLKVTDLLSGLITMYGIRCASLLRIIWLTEGIPK